MTPDEILDKLHNNPVMGSLNLRGRGHQGLVNLGNTCFLNVGLQALFHSMPLTRALLDGQFEPDIREHLDDPRIYLMLYYIRMNSAIWARNEARNGARNEARNEARNGARRTPPIIPRSFVDELRHHLPGWRLGTQHDAQETLIWLLDMFHECLSREVVYEVEGNSDKIVDKMRIEATKQWARHYQRPRSNNISEDGSESEDTTRPLRSRYSIILEIFGGQYLERFNCGECDHIAYKYESFLSSELQIETPEDSEVEILTIEDALEQHCELERLKEGNEWKCEKCEQKTLPLRRSSYWLLPQKCLILSLKRFTTEQIGNSYRSRKITKLIEYDPEKPLDMYPFVSNGLSNTLYSLYAIICHSGALGFGHYYMYCRDCDGDWWHFSDDQVTKVEDPNDLVTPHAYILLYRALEKEE